MNRILYLTTFFISLSATLCGQQVDADDRETGELQITFKFKGKRPDPIPLELPASCGSLKMNDETLIVSGNNNGIMNVVVYAIQSRGGNLPKYEPRKKKLTLACWNCRFVPRITTAEVGDRLKIRNMDPVGYSVNFNFFRNQSRNLAMAAGREESFELTESEPAVIPVASNVFPWMVSYILVVNHPYYGVSDPDGKLVIRGLPVGDDLVLRAWHERGTFKNEIYVNDEKTRWIANKFSVDIKPGKNDYGVVAIPGNELGLDEPAQSP